MGVADRSKDSKRQPRINPSTGMEVTLRHRLVSGLTGKSVSDVQIGKGGPRNTTVHDTGFNAEQRDWHEKRGNKIVPNSSTGFTNPSSLPPPPPGSK